MKNKRILTIRLDEDILKSLSILAEREKIPRAAVVRKAIEFFLKNKEKISSEDVSLIRRVRELENKYYSVINKTNIILKQLEHFQKRAKSGK